MFEELLSHDLQKLYEADENAWREKIIGLLEEGRLSEIDHVNLKVVLAEMGKSEIRGLKSHLSELILHILKARHQPERASRSWYNSIMKQRLEIQEIFNDSPSLKNVAEREFETCYERGRRFAIRETQLSETQFPQKPEFNLEYALTEIPHSLIKFKGY